MNIICSFLKLARQSRSLQGTYQNVIRQVRLKYCCRKFNIQNIPLYRFSTVSTKFTDKDFEDLKRVNSQKLIETDSLMDQFNCNIHLANNHNLTLEICRYYLQVFNKRMENDKAVEVCQSAINFLKAHDTPTEHLLQFLLQKMYLNYEMGNLYQAHQTARDVEDEISLYPMSAEVVDLKIQAIYQLIEVQEIELPSSLLKKMIDHKYKSYDNLEDSSLLEIYSIYSKCCFLEQHYQEAVFYSKAAYAIYQKQEVFVDDIPSLLLPAFVSLKKLGKKEESEEIQKELKKQRDFDIAIFNEKKYDPFEQLFIYRNSNKDEARKLREKEKLEQIEDENSGRNILWNETIDQQGLYFYEVGNFTEGIKFYEGILEKLDPDLDWLRRANIMERIAELYRCSSNLSQAIEISLNVHQLLLNKRNFLLVNDGLTLLNLTHIKNYYYEQNNYEKAYEWGKKWNVYCHLHDFFSVLFSEQILLSMNYHLHTLQILKKDSERLAYTKLIQKYLQSVEMEEEERQTLLQVQQSISNENQI